MSDSLLLLLPENAGPSAPEAPPPRRRAHLPKSFLGIPVNERLTLAKFYDFLGELAASKKDLRERASILAYRATVFAGPSGVVP